MLLIGLLLAYISFGYEGILNDNIDESRYAFAWIFFDLGLRMFRLCFWGLVFGFLLLFESICDEYYRLESE